MVDISVNDIFSFCGSNINNLCIIIFFNAQIVDIIFCLCLCFGVLHYRSKKIKYSSRGVINMDMEALGVLIFIFMFLLLIYVFYTQK
jgi:hypothetical protein